VIEKAVEILDALSRSGDGLGVSELSRQTGLPKSTVHNILGTLVDTGLAVVGDQVRSRYAIGARSLRWSDAFLDRLEVRAVAQPFLEQLRDVTGETATLMLRTGNERACVARAVSLNEVRHEPHLGTSHPLWFGASGYALLSGWSVADVVAYLRATPRAAVTARTSSNRSTVLQPVATDESTILQRVADVQREGCSVQDEAELGFGVVAVPIRDHSGAVNAAVVVTGPLSRWNGDASRVKVPVILRICAGLSRKLGWNGVEDASTLESDPVLAKP
jgi:DNA-binding IclR family transcriptional regulator